MSTENSQKIKGFLTKAGLTEKEISAYIYLSTYGPQHVSILAKACGMTRTNGYDVVKTLEKKGLCFNLGSLYGRKVQANPISQIKKIIKEKELELINLERELSTIEDVFKKIEKPRKVTRTNTSYFEGEESIKKLIMMSTRSTEREVLTVGSEIDLVDSLGSDFFEIYHEKRKVSKIYLKSIRPGNKRASGEVFSDDKKYIREVRVHPEGKIRLKSNMFIWDNYVAIITNEDRLVGTLIESAALSIMLKSWFSFIWEYSK